MASHTLNRMLYTKLLYNPDKDIVAISRVATLANLLGVTPSLPANSVAELIALSARRSRASTRSPRPAPARRFT